LQSKAVESYNNVSLRAQLPKCSPFIKWAGGKSQLIVHLNKYIPPTFTKYFEPFLGGSAFFLYLSTDRNMRFEPFLSDTNTELMNAYKVVRNSVEELIRVLNYHQKKYKHAPYDYYYELRARVKPLNDIESAARFIALNKTCYNGLYRVNKKGVFNVPMGRYNNPRICDATNLRNVSFLLRTLNAHLMIGDYESILVDKVEEGDFVYLDPPYNPVSTTANFTGYTNIGFNKEDQSRLADVFRKLDEKNCYVLLSNSETPYVRKLYESYSDYIVTINANRAINSKATSRSGHKELLIRNYK
jgi:DNA adenine methylase